MKTKTRKTKKQSNILSGDFNLTLSGTKKAKGDILGGNFDLTLKGEKGKSKSDKVIFGSSASYLK